MQKIPRVIFNFNDRCLNGCPFCFIPFDHKGVGDVGLWREIIARANEFLPDMISFSGCDPFYYSDFYTLLETAEKKSAWGVDTSLVWLEKERFADCFERLDQISTSWDDVPQMPVYQRYAGEKYRRFVENIEYVIQYMPQLVVHTLLSHKNKEYLQDIAEELIKRKVRTWSMYQFWPFEFIHNAQDYMTTPELFEEKGRMLEEYVAGRLDYEYVPYLIRANGYFFVSSQGKVYTTLPGTVGSYKELGTIFDQDIYEKWFQWSNPAAAGEILEKKLKRETIPQINRKIVGC